MISETSQQTIQQILVAQRTFFATHQTKNIDFRLQQLKKLLTVIQKNEKAIADALWNDLHKSYEEAYLTEISLVLGEIKLHLRKLRKWSKPQRIATPLALLPSTSKILTEPLGVSLIVAPWNYPFQLLFNPLIGAISSGCTAILKPSPNAPHIALLMQQMIEQTFDQNYIAVVQGSKETNQLLFAEKFDFIFFTGSPYLGKIVMKAAAEHLTPVVLELGGKSPCIVDKEADIEVAAKRIAWGKCINAGQTCIAPDYLLVQHSLKSKLIPALSQSIEKQYGSDVKTSNYYPRIITDEAFDRLNGLLQQGKIVYGGQTDKAEKYISPTIVDEVLPEHDSMQQEIFGPILPIISYNDISEAIDFINKREKPLALYYFGSPEKGKQVLAQTTSGGACLNDTLMHIANHKLPFGGVGNSGMNKYHGYESFKAFSNTRAVVVTPTWIDLPFKYVPFKYFNWIKKIL